jgi:general secretion pathway protein K
MSAAIQRVRCRQLRGSAPRRQRGIAMLVAILLVALGTIVAAAVAYESAMSARRGSASLAFDEALLVGEGAEALAAYGLQQVLQNTKASAGSTMPDVYPAQPWAQPVGPIEVVPGITLEASLEDMQGRFNLNWLVDSTAQAGTPTQPGSNPVPVTNGTQPGTSPTAAAIAAFNHLLELAKVDPQWTDKIIDWIDSDQTPQPQGMEDSGYLSQNPPYLTANQYLTSTTELLAIPGFGRDNYEKLAPYISALPVDQNTKLNICSAPGLVLDALKGGGTTDFSSDPQALEKNRATAPGCFPNQNDYMATVEDPNEKAFVQSKIGTTSQYFRLTSLITIGTTEFNLYSLLLVDTNGYFVHPIQRSFTPD